MVIYLLKTAIKMLDYSAITKLVLRKRLSGNTADHSENLIQKRISKTARPVTNLYQNIALYQKMQSQHRK